MRSLAALAAALVAVALLALAGCGDDRATPTATTAGPVGGQVAPGGGLSVEQAIASDAEPPLAVSGWVVGTGNERRFCSAYEADAEEPCGEPSLALEGQVDATDGDRATLFGAVQGGLFVVSSNVTG